MLGNRLSVPDILCCGLASLFRHVVVGLFRWYLLGIGGVWMEGMINMFFFLSSLFFLW